MPTFLYQCQECNTEFEEYHSISAEPEGCSKCIKEGKTGKNLKKLINAQNGFQLLGSGWAKDNYK